MGGAAGGVTPISDFFYSAFNNELPGKSVVRKFGRNTAIGTSIVPVSMSGLYQTPTSAQSLEIVSSSANDTSNGSGARTVYIEGLDASFSVQSTTVTMNWTNAVALTGTWTRVYRMYIATSGTYATSSAGSQVGTITLRNSGAGVTWALLALDGSFGLGQSLIGAYTIPAGYTGTVYLSYLSVETTKSASFYFFMRENADDVTTPYSPMRIQGIMDGVTGFADFGDNHVLGVFGAKTDIGFMAKVAASTATASVEFRIILKAV